MEIDLLRDHKVLTEGVSNDIQDNELKAPSETDRLSVDFCSNLTFELQTHLTNISALLEMIDEGVLGGISPDVHEKVKMMRIITQKMNTSLEEAIWSTRVISKELHLRCVIGSVEDLLQETKDKLLPLSREKHIDVEFHPISQLPDVQMDERALSTVLAILLRSSIQLAVPKSRILIRAILSNDEIEISFACTGYCITEKESDFLFNNKTMIQSDFENAISNLSPFGLYTAKHISEQLGGSLRMENAPDIGTTIYLLMPVMNRSDET